VVTGYIVTGDSCIQQQYTTNYKALKQNPHINKL